jgi:hypothetical protein
VVGYVTRDGLGRQRLAETRRANEHEVARHREREPATGAYFR